LRDALKFGELSVAGRDDAEPSPCEREGVETGRAQPKRSFAWLRHSPDHERSLLRRRKPKWCENLQPERASGFESRPSQDPLLCEAYAERKEVVVNVRTALTLAVVIAASTGGPLPAASAQLATAPCTPACVFERMQRAVNALPYPPYVAFTFEDKTASRRLQTELLRVLVRTSDGVAVMTQIRDYRGNTIAKPQAVVVAKGLDFMNVSNVHGWGTFHWLAG
jgi:hypothetical protein